MDQLHGGVAFARWGIWVLGWLPVLVQLANNPKLTQVLGAFTSISALAGVSVMLMLVLAAFSCCYLRPGCCECLCLRCMRCRRPRSAGSNYSNDPASRRVLYRTQPTLWNPELWQWWVILRLAGTLVQLAFAVLAIIWVAHTWITSFTSATTSTGDSPAHRFALSEIVTDSTQHDTHGTATSEDTSSVRGALQPMGAGLSASLFIASVGVIVEKCMRLLIFWQGYSMSFYRISVELASTEEPGSARLAEARRVEQLSRELVYIEQRAEGLGHKPSPWLVNQIVHKTTRVLLPLYVQHVLCKSGGGAGPAGPSLTQFASNLQKAVEAEQRTTRAIRPPSPLLSGLPDVLLRLLSTRSEQVPSLKEVQDLGKSLRELDLLEMAEGHQHPPCRQHDIMPQTAWDAALLMQLCWVHLYHGKDKSSLVRLHLLGNVFFMLRSWKAAPEAGEHQLRMENSPAYRICNMLRQSRLHAEHHNGVKQAVCLIDPSDEAAEVERLATIMAFVMLSDASIVGMVNESTSPLRTGPLDESASAGAGAGAGAGADGARTT